MNLNTPESLSATTRRIFEHLRYLPAAPGVTIGGGAETAPRDPMVDIDVDNDDDNPDERENQQARDARIRPTNDYGPIHGDILHRDISLNTSPLDLASATHGHNVVSGTDAVGTDANYLESSLCSAKSKGRDVRAGGLEDVAPADMALDQMESESGTTKKVDVVLHSTSDEGLADCSAKSTKEDSVDVISKASNERDVHPQTVDSSGPSPSAAQSVQANLHDQNHALLLSTDTTDGTNETCKDCLERFPAAGSDCMDIDQDPSTLKIGGEVLNLDMTAAGSKSRKDTISELEVMDLDGSANLQTAAVSTANTAVPMSAAAEETVGITHTAL